MKKINLLKNKLLNKVLWVLTSKFTLDSHASLGLDEFDYSLCDKETIKIIFKRLVDHKCARFCENELTTVNLTKVLELARKNVMPELQPFIKEIKKWNSGKGLSIHDLITYESFPYYPYNEIFAWLQDNGFIKGPHSLTYQNTEVLTEAPSNYARLLWNIPSYPNTFKDDPYYFITFPDIFKQPIEFKVSQIIDKIISEYKEKFISEHSFVFPNENAKKLFVNYVKDNNIDINNLSISLDISGGIIIKNNEGCDIIFDNEEEALLILPSITKSRTQ